MADYNRCGIPCREMDRAIIVAAVPVPLTCTVEGM
jgi:hypothetical protein